MTTEFVMDSYIKKNGTQAIRFRITKDRKIQYITTGFSIEAKQWDQAKGKVKNHPLAQKITATLNRLEIDFNNFCLDHQNKSLGTIVDRWKSRSETNQENFIDFCREQIEKDKLILSFATCYGRNSSVNSLSQFKSNIPFNELTRELMEGYKYHLLKKGLSSNSVKTHITRLRVYILKAQKLGLIKENPLQYIKLETNKVNRVILSIEEIDKLESISSSGGFRNSKKWNKKLVIDSFLFCFYAGGMRFTDMCLLKNSDIQENQFSYVMSKVKNRSGSNRIIDISPKLKRIIDEYSGDSMYLFPYIDRYKPQSDIEQGAKLKTLNSRLNKILRKIAEANGIKEFTFHCAKHSFANYAVRSKIGLLTISKLLGHKRLETTQVYLQDFYQEDQGDAMHKMFG